jgi:hypothetical protein
VAACFVNDVFAHLLAGYQLELLAELDQVLIGVRHTVGEFARIVGRS